MYVQSRAMGGSPQGGQASVGISLCPELCRFPYLDHSGSGPEHDASAASLAFDQILAEGWVLVATDQVELRTAGSRPLPIGLAEDRFAPTAPRHPGSPPTPMRLALGVMAH